MGSRADNKYLQECEALARKSDCKLITFGVVIVKDDQIIGRGYNHGIKPHKCLKEKNYKLGSNIGACYGIHAEWQALSEALQNGEVKGASLYIMGKHRDFTAVDATKFRCTVCARLIFLNELKEVVTVIDGKIVRRSPEEIVESAYEDLLGSRAEET